MCFAEAFHQGNRNPADLLAAVYRQGFEHVAADEKPWAFWTIQTKATPPSRWGPS